MGRIQIDRARNEVVLTLNERIYPGHVVQQAIEDYAEVCEIFQNKKSILLRPTRGHDAETVGYEFCNYILGLIKNT